MEIQLAQIQLFSGLTNEEIEVILSKIVFQRKSFSADSLVVSQGEECNRLMILTEGWVKAEMSGPTGKSLKIEDMQAPNVLASAFLFGKKNFFPVNIIASTNVRFLVIPRGELLKLFQINAVVLQNFLTMISTRAQFLSEKLRFHSFKSLRAKLAFYLMNEAQQQSTFKLRHSQNELAELFGVARPSVGRIFMQLQEDGVIDIRYKQVSIVNRQMLIEICSE
jgi:CRP-like cAMP-binding protein